MTVAAAVLLGMAVALWQPSGRWWVARRLGSPTRGAPVGAAVALAVAGGAAAATLLSSVPGPGVAVAMTLIAMGAFAVGQSRRSRARARIAGRRAEVAELVGLMAADLRAGALPQRTLAGLVEDFGFVAPAARAVDLGGDVVGILREAATVPGREVLRDLAGAWHVAERSGAPLASVLGRLEHAARADRELAREVSSGVAPARATGRLMAALPVVGLLLGSGAGGDPVAMLTTTWIGAACLAAGCALACGGLAWIERIAASAEAP